MGYCYTTGEIVDGRWKFKKCDGRKSSDCRSCDIQDKKNKDCVEYCKTWSGALRAVKILDKKED